MEEKVTVDKRKVDEISLSEIIYTIRGYNQYLLKKWIIIVFFGCLGGALGFVYAWYKKPVYKAEVTFVLEDGDKQGGLGQYAGLASMVGIDLGGGGGGIFQGDNIFELYKSRTMIEKTLLTEIVYNNKKQLLIERYIDFNRLRQDWNSKEELRSIQFNDPAHFTRLQDSIMGLIVSDINRNYLIVDKLDKKSSIIKVDVKAYDEFFAKSFNENIVKNVNDFYVQTKTKKALENVNILQQKTDSVRRILNSAIYTAAAVADATPNLNITRQAQRIVPAQRSQFSAETNKAILGELVKNLEMSKIALHKERPLIQVIDTPVYPLEKDKLGKLKGIILGGILFGILTIFVLLIRKFVKNAN